MILIDDDTRIKREENHSMKEETSPQTSIIEIPEIPEIPQSRPLRKVKH